MPQRRLLTVTSVPEILIECAKRSAIKDAVFTEEYPKEEVTMPTITWSVLRRLPGKQGKETKKSRYRGKLAGLADKDEIVFGQWMTVIYQFDLYHMSNVEVNELMLDFEQFLMEATPALIRAGIDIFIFDEQTRDDTIPVPKDSRVRTLRYMAIFTATQSVYLPRVRDIKLAINMDVSFGTATLTRGNTDADFLPKTELVNSLEIPLRISDLVRISDTPLDNTSDYESNIDYYFGVDDSGNAMIVWLPAGKQPRPGKEYYITYTKIENYFETDVLRSL